MSLTLYQHPFAMYCWKTLLALYERELPFTSVLVEADRSALAALWPPGSIPLFGRRRRRSRRPLSSSSTSISMATLPH